MEILSEEDYEILALVYHDIIYSYQKTIRETLGNSDTAILNLANYLCENIPLVDVEVSKLGFEGLVGVLGQMIEKMKLGKVVLEKFGDENYLFHFENCKWARYYHPRRNPSDVTCPWALIVMAMFQSSFKKPVFVADTQYLANGSITKIRAVSEVYNQIALMRD